MERQRQQVSAQAPMKKGRGKMALGIAIKTITTKESYTIEELFEKMKGHTFTAGEPYLTKHGAATIIVFPPLDRQNQVWILRTGFKEKAQKFSIQKGEEAGVGNAVTNMALDKVTGGLFGFGRMVGKTVKECERLVGETAKELEALNL